MAAGDAVCHDVGRVRNDQLAGACNPSGPSEIGIGAEALDGGSNGPPDSRGCLGIVLPDELANCFKIVECAR